MENFIDLTQLEPIPYKNTIAVLNEYILQNIDFLNKFGHFNENKLFEMEVVLDEIESKVLLLEKKLDSVPPEFYNGLVVPPLQQQQQVAQQLQAEPQMNDFNENQSTYATAAAPQAPPPGQNYQQSPAVPDQAQFQSQPPAQEQQIYQPEQPQVEEQQPEEEVEDERLDKYKKLLSYGVMPAQLKMKMEMEGVDPKLLDKYIT